MNKIPTRASSRKRNTPITLLAESSKIHKENELKLQQKKISRETKKKEQDKEKKELEKQKKELEKQKKELEKQKKEEDKQKELNLVAKFNTSILSKKIDDNDLKNSSEKITLNKSNKKFNFSDILIWKSMTEIKKIIQKKILNIDSNQNIDNSDLFDKYGVLQKKFFKDFFQNYIDKNNYKSYEQLLTLNELVDNIFKDYNNDNPKLQKYAGLYQYLQNIFDEFKLYIFPQFKILQDYKLFSQLINFYFDKEFKSNKSMIGQSKFNEKVKKRILLLINILNNHKFITQHNEYKVLLNKFERLNKEILNSDLPLIESVSSTGLQLTDRDITKNISKKELDK